MSIFAELNQSERGTSFESGGGDFAPIPSGTELKAMIEDCQWQTPREEGRPDFVSLRWKVIDGEYNNRVIFQKVHIKDAEEKKRKKALNMLSAIDKNCGSGIEKLGTMPTDAELNANLLHKPMAIKVQAWNMTVDGERKQGNWVSKVSALNSTTPKPTPQVSDDDIPFA